MAKNRRNSRQIRVRNKFTRLANIPTIARVLAAHARTGQMILQLDPDLQVDTLGKTPLTISHRTYRELVSVVNAAVRGSSERKVGLATPTGTVLDTRATLGTARQTAIVGTTVDDVDPVFGVMFRIYAAFNNMEYGPYTLKHGFISNNAGTLEITAANTIYSAIIRPGRLPSRFTALAVSNAGTAFNVTTGDYGNAVGTGATAKNPGWLIESMGNANLLIDCQTLNQKDLSAATAPCYGSMTAKDEELKDALDGLSDEDFDLEDYTSDLVFPGIS